MPIFALPTIYYMPLDRYAHYDGAPLTEGPNAVAELRHLLIGNSDLKLKLIKEPTFLDWFSDQLKSSVHTLIASDAPAKAQVYDLHSKIVILRILVKFASSQPELASGVPFEGCTPLLSRLLQYVTDVYIPQLVDSRSSGEPEYAALFEDLICNCFHVILGYANMLKLNSDETAIEAIWKLLTVLLILSEDRSKDLFILKRVVIAGFKVIPFCLERGPRDSKYEYAEALLSVALRKLHNEFSSIYAFYFPNADANELSVLAVTSAPAPNVIPEKRLLEETFDFALMTSLMTGVAQILNYFKEHGARPLVSPGATKFFASPKLYFCMLFLLGCDNSNILNVATLNLIRFYLSSHLDEPDANEGLAYTIFEKLFPRIIELLDNDYTDNMLSNDPIAKYLQLPVAVLSDLCLKYSGICVQLRNTNVDYRIMQEVENLFKRVSIFQQLHKLKVSSEKGAKLADFTVLRKAPESVLGTDETLASQDAQMSTISNYMLLLSEFTNSNEDFRRRITGYHSARTNKPGPNFLCVMIFEIVDNYRFLVQQMLLSYKLFGQWQSQKIARDEDLLAWFGSNIGVLYTLLDQPIYTNTLYLIRSLSRSVSTLRTFFVDCNSIRSSFVAEEPATVVPATKSDSIIDIVTARYDREISFDRHGSFVSSLLDIMSKFEELHTGMQFFTLLNSDHNNQRNQFRKSICVKKVMVLASIANFVLDFTSFRYEIVNHGTFLRDLAHILKVSIKAKEEYNRLKESDTNLRESAFEHLRVQLGVLQVIKNYLYNESEENRKFVWDFVPLSTIFEMSLYGICVPSEEDAELHGIQLQIKVISFEIMRNLTAASAYFSEAIKELYLEYAKQQQRLGTQIPATWNEYLVQNLLSYDLFVDVALDETDEKFFKNDEFLLRLIKVPEYVQLVIAINYLEDHRYTNISSFYKSNFPHKNLLSVWKRLLEVRLLDKLENEICGSNTNQKVRLSNQLSEIKVSVDWILINLTWKEEDYGYQMPDKLNFRLLDTVLSNIEGNSSSNLFTSSNIVIEESEEEDEAEGEPVTQRALSDDDTILSPEARARLLHKQGFSSILQRNIYDMSTPRSRQAKVGRRSPLERFDHLNSNDLFEKTKTAHYQIISLASGRQREQKTFRLTPHADPDEKHPLRRSSNIISSRDSVRIRRDVNRGGEGFGYGSDEEYLDAGEPEATAAPAADDADDIDEHWIG